MSNLDIALSYLKKGLSIVPLYSPAMIERVQPKRFSDALTQELKNNDRSSSSLSDKEAYLRVLTRICKQPYIKWSEYKDRKPTEDEVNLWFTQNPDANIGIITGKVSNIIVFDLDSPEALAYAEEEGGFPDTVKAQTGKGWHMYMQYPNFGVNNSVNAELTIDIRSDGGLVVAPPSIHGSGNQYTWEEGYSIFQIDPAPCTDWMQYYLEHLSDYRKQPGTVKETPAKVTTPPSEAVKSEQKNKGNIYLDLLRNGCRDGERNECATKLIGHLMKTNMPEAEMWETVNIWNQGKVKPPLNDAELKNTFNSVRDLEKKTQPKSVQIDALLYNAQTVSSEYKKNQVCIPFANGQLSNLEQRMNGGLMGGRFYIIGGIPSSGKTALVNNMADNICLNNYPVLFFSYDDGRTELLYRTMARFSGQDIEQFNKAISENISKLLLADNVSKIRSLKYVVQEMIPVEKWSELIEQIKKKHGKSPVIIIDYLRKIRLERANADERLRIDEILLKLTDLSKQYNMPVIAISELARDSYKAGQRLSMASFKESGMIEYEASWLGILAVVEEKNNGYEIKDNWESIIQHDGNIDLIIFKAKRGTGNTGKVPLQLDKSSMNVTDRNTETSKSMKKYNPKAKFA